MMGLAEHIVSYYIKKNIIDPKIKLVYVHGVSLIINDIINYLMILIISAIIDSFWHGVIFIVVFYFLRVHCGGFHALKEWICRMTMIMTCLSVFFIYNLIQYCSEEWCIPAIAIISAVMMIPIIPVENPNKKLTEEIRKKNKRHALVNVIKLR